MKKILATLSFVFIAFSAMGQTTLFHTGDGTGAPYRIPAIATAKNGDVIALSDHRPCGNDIGYGLVNILMRVSADNGATWSAVDTVLLGSGKGADTGYGDACLVADRDHNELLLVCVSGDTPYWKSKIDHPQRIVCTHANLDAKTGKWVWNKQPVDLTKQVYEDLLGNRINGLFMGSGRICQSKTVKVGKYYRVYGALCTHGGNFVIYSDDFGYNWKILGSATESCAPKGDEPKCEELPNGSVLLSSRKAKGRYFNVFHYTDVATAQGSWEKAVETDRMPGGITNFGSPTDGEILIVDAVSKNGRKTKLALQSVPAGPGRNNVTIYWKELRVAEDYNTAENFASYWPGHYQVSDKGSAYSTMTLQQDGDIGFYYEEEPQWYQMVYKKLSLCEITGGEYTIACGKKK